MKQLTIQKKTSEGFTLIELLVVIAVVGVLSAAVLASINPIDKINAGNDSNVQNAVSSIGRAAESYATVKNGFYPAALADLTSNGDLKVIPAAPAGYSAYVLTALPAACVAGSTCTSVTVTGQLKSIKYTATPVWRFESSTGKSCAVATVTTACP